MRLGIVRMQTLKDSQARENVLDARIRIVLMRTCRSRTGAAVGQTAGMGPDLGVGIGMSDMPMRTGMTVGMCDVVAMDSSPELGGGMRVLATVAATVNDVMRMVDQGIAIVMVMIGNIRVRMTKINLRMRMAKFNLRMRMTNCSRFQGIMRMTQVHRRMWMTKINLRMRMAKFNLRMRMTNCSRFQGIVRMTQVNRKVRMNKVRMRMNSIKMSVSQKWMRMATNRMEMCLRRMWMRREGMRVGSVSASSRATSTPDTTKSADNCLRSGRAVPTDRSCRSDTLKSGWWRIVDLSGR